MDRFVVVGCDGLIGSVLVRHLEGLPAVVYGTTRREGAVEGALALDLADLSRYQEVIDDIDRLGQTGPLTVFIAAAVTGYGPCENDPVASRRVNVTNTCLLAERLLTRGAFVVFLSSSAVFSGEHAVTENSVSDPASEYGRQKANAEARLIEAGGHEVIGAGVAVVRLTKVLSPVQPLMRCWIDVLERGERIDAATDLAFSPISLQYAARGLARIGAFRQAGIFHLSGARSIAYYDFAIALARALGVPESQVRPITLRGRIEGVPLQKIASLDMALTFERIGIPAQSMDDAILDLLAACRFPCARGIPD